MIVIMDNRTRAFLQPRGKNALLCESAKKYIIWKTYGAGNGRMEAVYEKLYKGRYREAGGG